MPTVRAVTVIRPKQDAFHRPLPERLQESVWQLKYNRRYSALIERFETAKNELEEINGERQTRMAKRQDISRFLETLEQSHSVVTTFDEGLWNATVESVTVYSNQEFTFKFKDGNELTCQI